MQLISKILLLAAALATGPLLSAQPPAPSPAAPAPSANATASPTPLSIADLTAQIAADEETLGKINADLKAAATPLPFSERSLQALGAQIDETTRILAGKPSLEKVRALQKDWQPRKETLATLKANLLKRLATCQQAATQLDGIQKKWARPKKTAAKKGEPPPTPGSREALLEALPADWADRMAKLTAAAAKSLREVQKQQTQEASLLAPIQSREAALNDLTAALGKAEPQAAVRLFLSDETPIWRVPIWSESRRMATGLNFAQEARQAWEQQKNALSKYIQDHSERLLIHAAAFAALLAALWWARRRLHAWAEDEPSLSQAAIVFEVPTSMAIALSLAVYPWVYEAPPRLLSAAAGAAALIPAVLILRRLIDRHLYAILNLLVAFYFVDQLRIVASGFPIAARLLFLAELAGGCGLLAWMLFWTRRLTPQHGQDARLARATLFGAKAELALLASAFFANAIGCVDLGNLAGNAALGSAYLAVIFYAAARILDGFILGALSIEPLANLRAVRRHRKLIWQRTHLFIKTAAVILWGLGTLELLTLRGRVLEILKTLLFRENHWTLLGQALVFGVVIWAAFLLSRFIRFLLEEDVYPRAKMERGLSYAVSTVIHYAILLVGFIFAAARIGLDMTKFTILVSAFGVGMGFGLQNIINNFVSGIILLFERPIKVGDIVQLDAATIGTVDRIGIRASIVRTENGSEIILPNSKLISNQVINWTLSNRQRAIELTLPAARGADPCRIIEHLTQIAAAHPLIASDPTPTAQLVSFDLTTLQFKLTAWTDHIETCEAIRSELATAALGALEQEAHAS